MRQRAHPPLAQWRQPKRKMDHYHCQSVKKTTDVPLVILHSQCAKGTSASGMIHN